MNKIVFEYQKNETLRLVYNSLGILRRISTSVSRNVNPTCCEYNGGRHYRTNTNTYAKGAGFFWQGTNRLAGSDGALRNRDALRFAAHRSTDVDV